jgi:hypothetical protein
MWRTMHLNFRVQEMLIATTMDVQPSLWKRDAKKIQRIEQAIGLEAVLDLAPSASGLAEYAWLKRLFEFGSSVAPAIVRRLNSDWIRSHGKERIGIQERIIGAMRFCDGQAAAEAILECWDALDEYGRSLACVAIGLLGVHPAADRLWKFFEKTQSKPKPLGRSALGLDRFREPSCRRRFGRSSSRKTRLLRKVWFPFPRRRSARRASSAW